MFADGFADGVDLLKGLLDGVGAHDFSGDPNGEEDGGEAAFAHAGDVDVTVRVARGEVEFGIEEALGGVVVSVDDYGGGVKFLCLLGTGVGGHQKGSQRETENEANGAVH